MNRWTVRILALLMILAFGLMFTMIYKQLVMMQRSMQPAATSSSR